MHKEIDYIPYLKCSCGTAFIRGEKRVFCNECKKGFSLVENILISEQLSEQNKINPYKDIDYESRGSVALTTTWCELPFYEAFINETIEHILAKGILDTTAIDLGCGDGRFTQLLIKKGVPNISSVDLDFNNLKRLQSRLEIRDSPVQLVLSDLRTLKFVTESLDLVLAIDVLANVDEDREKIYQKIFDGLKPGGLFVVADPLVEGALSYALVMRDLEEFEKIISFSTKKIGGHPCHSDKEYRGRVYEQGELVSMAQKTGFEILTKKGISSFYSLLLGTGLFNNSELSDKKKNSLHMSLTQKATKMSCSDRILMMCLRKNK
ncbi:MAG: class I SAM-dependent methyltransferase [bacterium]